MSRNNANAKSETIDLCNDNSNDNDSVPAHRNVSFILIFTVSNIVRKLSLKIFFFCCFHFSEKAKRFKMSSNDLEIVITNNNPVTYKCASEYNVQLTESGEFWHMIVVSERL